MVTTDYRLEPHTSIPYHTGVAIPVFSLRSAQSFGVGDFSDLKSFADFVAKSGMDLIQILPINDTTTFMDWRDSYPYRAISVFALHPIYLDLADIRKGRMEWERRVAAEQGGAATIGGLGYAVATFGNQG